MKKAIVLSSIFLSQALVAAPQAQSTTQNYTAPTSQTTPAAKVQVTTSTAQKPDAAAPQTDRFTTSEDQKLGNDIRVQIAELIGAPNSNQIILIIDEGHVKLVGKVPTDDAKTKVVETIKKTKGVKSVANKLETAPAKKAY